MQSDYYAGAGGPSCISRTQVTPWSLPWALAWDVARFTQSLEPSGNAKQRPESNARKGNVL